MSFASINSFTSPVGNAGTATAPTAVVSDQNTRLRSGREVNLTASTAPSGQIRAAPSPRRLSLAALARRAQIDLQTAHLNRFPFGKQQDLFLPINSSDATAVAYLEHVHELMLHLEKSDSGLPYTLSPNRVSEVAIRLKAANIRGRNSMWNQNSMVRFLPKVGHLWAQGFRDKTLESMVDDIHRSQYSMLAASDVDGKIVARPVPKSTFRAAATNLIGYLEIQRQQGATPHQLMQLADNQVTYLYVTGGGGRHVEFTEFYEYVFKH